MDANLITNADERVAILVPSASGNGIHRGSPGGPPT